MEVIVVLCDNLQTHEYIFRKNKEFLSVMGGGMCS